MTIPEHILRDIIDASTPEHSTMPYVKAKYLMIGMSVDLSEYFVKLKADIEDSFLAPDLIDTAELDRIIKITTDEWLHVTSLTSDNVTNTITIDTDHPAVPSLRLPEEMCVMVLVGDDASKQNLTIDMTFLDYLEQWRNHKLADGQPLYGSVYDATDPNQRQAMQRIRSWDELRDYLVAREAREGVIDVAAGLWSNYEAALS